MWLLIAFILIPLIEIALFIQVGGAIGLWPTLGVVVVTAIAGSVLVRTQGAQALGQLRSSFDDLRDPTEPLAHGAMILFSGALLLTPGFFTDALGFALLVPAIRRGVLRYLRARISVQTVTPGSAWSPHEDTIIEGQFSETQRDDAAHAQDGNNPSGWQQR